MAMGFHEDIGATLRCALHCTTKDDYYQALVHLELAIDELQKVLRPIQASYKTGITAWEVCRADAYGADAIRAVRSLCFEAAFALTQRKGDLAATALAKAKRKWGTTAAPLGKAARNESSRNAGTRW